MISEVFSSSMSNQTGMLLMFVAEIISLAFFMSRSVKAKVASAKKAV